MVKASPRRHARITPVPTEDSNLCPEQALEVPSLMRCKEAAAERTD